jgi:hypothetical protein
MLIIGDMETQVEWLHCPHTYGAKFRSFGASSHPKGTHYGGSGRERLLSIFTEEIVIGL